MVSTFSITHGYLKAINNRVDVYILRYKNNRDKFKETLAFFMFKIKKVGVEGSGAHFS